MNSKSFYLILVALLAVSCKQEVKVTDQQEKKVTNDSSPVDVAILEDVMTSEEVKSTPAESTKINFSDLHGAWKITRVEGQLFITIEGRPEIEAPINIWLGKVFHFDKEGKVRILDNGKEWISSEYKYDGKDMSVPKFGGKYGMKTVISGNKMQMIQTPESYYEIMSVEGKMPIEQVKKMFRVPTNVVFHLEKI